VLLTCSASLLAVGQQATRRGCVQPRNNAICRASRREQLDPGKMKNREWGILKMKNTELKTNRKSAKF